MKRSQLGWYSAGLAALVGVLFISGVPASTALFVTILLAWAVDLVSDELAKFVEPMLVAPFEITSVEDQQILPF